MIFLLAGSALSSPVDIDALEFSEASAGCDAGEETRCDQLADVFLASWLQSIWGSLEGVDEVDERRYAALRLYLSAGYCFRGSEGHCRFSYPQKVLSLREETPAPLCKPDEPTVCFEPRPLKPLETMRFVAPQPHGDGWVTFANGRIYPRSQRSEVLIEGADQAWSDGKSWVFAPTLTTPGRSDTVSVLTRKGWRDRTLDLDGEGICSLRDGLIWPSTEGRCGNPERLYRLQAKGKVEAVDRGGLFDDTAGDFALRRGETLRIERGGKTLWESEVPNVGLAVVSPSGKAAWQVNGAWTLLNGDQVVELEGLGATAADWSDEALFLAVGKTLVRVAPDGRWIDAWALPETVRSIRVHPQGHSVWVVPMNLEAGMWKPVGQLLALEDVPEVTLPGWLVNAARHRLPVAPPEAKGTRVRLELKGQPVEGAYVGDQYTDAEGGFIDFGGFPRVRIHGAERMTRGRIEDNRLEVLPIVTTRAPDGRSHTLRTVSGRKLQVGMDLGDGEIGIIAPETPSVAVTAGLDFEISVDEKGARWTPLPRRDRVAVDEEGVPLPGLLVQQRGAPGSSVAITGLDGRFTLRDVDSRLFFDGVEGRLEGDRVVFSHPPATGAVELGTEVEVAELEGRWVQRTPEGRGTHERLFVPRFGMEKDGRRITQTESAEWLLPVDRDRLVVYRPDVRGKKRIQGFERLDDANGETDEGRFVGRFGWQGGQSMTRSVDGRVVDEGSIQSDERGLRVDWMLRASSGRFPGARSFYLTKDGGMLGSTEEDEVEFRQQLSAVLKAEGKEASHIEAAGALFGELSHQDWKGMTRGAWFRELGALMGRALVKDQTETVILSGWDAAEEPQPLRLTYRGLVPCTLGQCARIELEQQIGVVQSRVELWLDPGTLRPARRRERRGKKVYDEIWSWSL